MCFFSVQLWLDSMLATCVCICVHVLDSEKLRRVDLFWSSMYFHNGYKKCANVFLSSCSLCVFPECKICVHNICASQVDLPCPADGPLRKALLAIINPDPTKFRRWFWERIFVYSQSEVRLNFFWYLLQKISLLWLSSFEIFFAFVYAVRN